MGKKLYSKFALEGTCALLMVVFVVACSAPSVFFHALDPTLNSASSVTGSSSLASASSSVQSDISPASSSISESLTQSSSALHSLPIQESEIATSSQPISSYNKIIRGTSTPDGLRLHLKEVLTDDQYTYFYYAHGGGVGVATPDREAVEAAVSTYIYPDILVEYKETPFSRSILQAARQELSQWRTRHDAAGNRLVMNVSYNGIEDGYIHITIDEMHPVLEEFLQNSQYGHCIRVEVTDEGFVVDPATCD